MTGGSPWPSLSRPTLPGSGWHSALTPSVCRPQSRPAIHMAGLGGRGMAPSYSSECAAESLKDIIWHLWDFNFHLWVWKWGNWILQSTWSLLKRNGRFRVSLFCGSQNQRVWSISSTLASVHIYWTLRTTLRSKYFYDPCFIEEEIKKVRGPWGHIWEGGEAGFRQSCALSQCA